MIVYFDTSALVKAYVEEAGTEWVLEHLSRAEIAATHAIAYVEARSAFARLARGGHLAQSEFENLKAQFEADWPKYTVVGSDSDLLRRAANMAEAFGLRAYDSVHLAAAEYLAVGMNKTVTFICFDHKLCQAASVLRMNVTDSS